MTFAPLTQDGAVEPPPSWLCLDTWRYSDLFDPSSETGGDAVITEIETMVENVKLDEHPFFSLAETSRPALQLWVSQELVMTNAFSQLVLRAASTLTNVHARAVLSEVASGEHGRVRNGKAPRSHPWLLERLRKSIDLPRAAVVPLRPTRQFIARLASHLDSPLSAAAYIGVGNERLIVPEYKAIERCFAALIPKADFRPFLHANVKEDITHAKLCYGLAQSLIENSADEEAYRQAASASVQSRVTYFDELLLMAEEPTAQVL